ncbi:MAG: Rpn family recombination-promoting nuclease/putative transposase [Muribaculaceae bacterium]|nr:Rpn family recombination-promoting nuclease/putative transposase [Muribaculaceae bacterium]MCM1398962.1 Rpn family recombination-promoting nuclease/putative transposase [Clostridium sp.]MCM1458820.1 Rpn family recombination-promoting nuclease/putative transposase [Bacteroides sp.]
MNKNENKKRTAKNFEELELKDDFMFGVIMREPKYCKPFLETILGISISDIEYPRTQAIIALAADAKSVRLDVYVEDDKSTVYNIEMQVSVNKNLPKRSRYYQGMIDLNVLEKGEDYQDLKRSFVIFICTFDLFGKGRHIYTFENRCLQDYEIGLGDETTKVILNTKGTMDDVTPEMKRLLDYIDGQAASDEFTKELETAVKSVRSNEKWRLEYMTLEMHYQEKYEEGVEDGIEQGLEQGIKQCAEQLAIKMLKADKLSIAEISEYSGLTIEQITGLKAEISK